MSHLVIGGLKKLTGDIDIYVVVFTQWIESGKSRDKSIPFWHLFHFDTGGLGFDLPLMPDSDLLGV